MTALSPTMMPMHLAHAEPVSRPSNPLPAVDRELLIDERLFGAEQAQWLRHEDQTALTTVSYILFAIVSAGCLLMLGSVAVVLM